MPLGWGMEVWEPFLQLWGSGQSWARLHIQGQAVDPQPVRVGRDEEIQEPEPFSPLFRPVRSCEW